jgi:iron complex transport system permease protein
MNKKDKHSTRLSKPFRSPKESRRYWTLLIFLFVLGALSTYGLLVYNNPIPVDSPSFFPVVRRRLIAIVAMIIAAICQSLSTIAFQSITNNRIITPSILGFESLYSTIQTSMIYFFGVNTLISFKGTTAFFIQVIAMVLLSLLLYGWLLSGKYSSIQFMLLIGIVIGTGLGSLSSFMRRMLSPSEFDVLQARLFGSVNNADAEYFPIVIPLVIITALLLIFSAKKLNVLSLGKDVAMTFGLNYRRNMIYVLILVSILMSISTALVGPMTFFGFLVATLAYQAAPTYDHRYVFPMALAIGFLIMTSAYFFMYHVFNAQGVVSVIIELFGGLIFLTVILRKRIL